MSHLLYEQIDSFAKNYYYKQALDTVKLIKDAPADLSFILQLLSERRELKLDLVFEEDQARKFFARYRFTLSQNKELEKERLANYLLDLEAKVRVGDLIDFCRASSPLIYRIYLALITKKLPDLEEYIHNSKDTSYDKWRLDRIEKSDNACLKAFYKQNKHQPLVNSSSLLSLIECMDYPKEVITSVRKLRHFEKSIRNPLAHLIKPFDEEILASSTGFSSQVFLDLMIFLVKEIGVNYSSRPYYFDKANQEVIIPLLKESLKNTKD